jgi:hypothetical protein
MACVLWLTVTDVQVQRLLRDEGCADEFFWLLRFDGRTDRAVVLTVTHFYTISLGLDAEASLIVVPWVTVCPGRTGNAVLLAHGNRHVCSHIFPFNKLDDVSSLCFPWPVGLRPGP